MIRLPAEWEPQVAVVIAWPHSGGDFTNLSAVENTYNFIAKSVSRFQALIVICKNGEHQQHIQSILDNTPAHFIHADFDDIWVRDTLFLSVEWDHPKCKLQLLNFRFNGWGEKYPHRADNALNLALFAHPIFKGHPNATLDPVLEGGSIESDGQGSILTTRNCLLNPNRNPQYSPTEIEHLLQSYLGAKRILWLEQPHLAGDDTDAHIDTLARFVDPKTIAYSSCDDPEDIHYQSLKAMETQLQAFTTMAGEPYRLVPLPLPKPVFDGNGRRLPANYANFLLINGAVLVPVYGDDRDQLAIQRLSECFPEREIIPTPCRALVHQYGSLHCATMQIPAVVHLNF